MRKFLNKLVRNENGATAIEYGLIAALLAIGIIAAVQGVRTQLVGTFGKVSSELNTAKAGVAATN
jgi:pilus assembly protein Flp/PilA